MFCCMPRPVREKPQLRPLTNPERRAGERKRKHTQRNQQQLAKLRADRSKHPSSLLTQPPLTPKLAAAFAKLTMVGVPQVNALRYCAPEYFAVAGEEGIFEWLKAWLNDPRLLHAMSALNGAEWHDLSADARLTIAFDKHMAELAYFLYSHTYERLDGIDLKKADNARDALQAYLDKGTGDPDSPFNRFVEEFMKQSTGQTDMKVTPMVMPIASIKES